MTPPAALYRFFGTITGPLEMGRGLPFWGIFLLVLMFAASAPLFMSLYDIITISSYLISVFLALSLTLIWGYAGILSLGQAAFLGLGGYIYGIVGINLIETSGNTHLALLAGLLLPVVFAALIGLVLFYARIQGVFVAILMLVVTLLIQAFFNQTAGEGWFVGIAHLGGNNGLGRFSGAIREPPSLTFELGQSVFEFGGQSFEFYYLTLALLVVTYLGLRYLVNSRFGHVIVAIREDAGRTETLGYDVRFIQLVVFCLSAFIASISGILYVSWGNFITPDVFGIYNNILPIIWVSVGGRKSLTGAVVSTLVMVWLARWLGINGNYAFIILGGILIGSMMLFPDGVVTGLFAWFSDLRKDKVDASEASGISNIRTNIERLTPKEIYSDEKILETKNLIKAFGGVRATRNISFSVTKGELRCIIGPNGAGKSTFFKLLIGTHKPTQGRVLLGERDITHIPAFRRARMGIGIKFQNTDVFPELTVRHNLSIPLHHAFGATEIDGEIERLLAQLHLPGQQDCLVKELSHGGRQMLAIGMAVAMKPTVLLLDEPTAGLGPVETRYVGDLILELNHQGVTILVVEHDMGFVKQLGAPVTVLHHGELFAEGSLEEISNLTDVRTYVSK